MASSRFGHSYLLFSHTRTIIRVFGLITMGTLMNDTPSHYRVYLLTVWQESSAQGSNEIWRFRLEEPRSGQSRTFANATSLVAALMRAGRDLDSISTTSPPENPQLDNP